MSDPEEEAIRQKAAVIKKSCGAKLYNPTLFDNRSLPLREESCRHRAVSVIAPDVMRQCSRYARVHLGGIGFCWQHAERIRAETGLEFD